MPIAHIFNGELGFDVRTKLNDVIDIVNAPPSGGMAIGGAITSATAGSVLFAGVGGILAQDNTNFFWDDALNDLHIGGKYYIAAAPALFMVPGSPENNWFEGNSGNATVTGYGNFGTGDQTLLNITSGFQNVAVGTAALRQMQSGYRNLGMGTNALRYSVSDINNIAIGANALQTLGISGAGGGGNSGNVVLGFGALSNAEQAYNNVVIGYTALANIYGSGIVGYNNTVVGAGAGNAIGLGSSTHDNTFIGTNAAALLQGGSSNNTWIGSYQGLAATVNNTIAISDGSGTTYLLDCGLTRPHAWSFGFGNEAVGVHIYGYASPKFSATNYERVSLDYDLEYYATQTFRIASHAGGSGTRRLISIDGHPKAGAPAASDLASGSFAVIDDTSANKTWLAFNKAGTIRQTEIGGAGGGGGGMSIGGAITSATAGSVLFAGAAGVLAQDNTNFFWDDSLNDLHIGGAYYVSSARALYVVPNVSGNNWFEGNAGNQMLSGYDNFGTGDLALGSLTTGIRNVALGGGAAKFMTTGNQNFAMGSLALWFNVADSNNTAIGYSAMATLGIGGSGGGGNANNIAVGFGAFSNCEQGSSNVVIGPNALNSVVAPATASFNTIIGNQAGNNLGVSAGSGAITQNTLIGTNAGSNLSGASVNNVYVGGYKGPSAAIGYTVALSDGSANTRFLLDCNVTTSWAWTFNADAANAIGALVHFYGFQSAIGTASNYERLAIDLQNTANVHRIRSEKGGSGTLRIIAIDGFGKAGAPAAGDLPASSFAVIDDTSAGQTWLVFNKAGTIRKVQLT